MRSSFPLWALSVLAIALFAANMVVRREPSAGDAFVHEPEPGAQVMAEPKQTRNASDPSPVTAAKSSSGEPATPKAAPSVTGPSIINWASVETTDYRQYAANLRALGFPEELVQAIVIADLNKLYEPREAPLRPKAVPYDTPVSQRSTKVTPEELARMRQLRDVQLEKQAAIKEILGIDVPREIMKTPSPRNYEAFDYALNLLPPEKRDAVQIAIEDEWIAADMQKHLPHASFLEVYDGVRAQRNAALAAILTPEEFQRFEMNTTPAGTELARRVIGMEPNDDEFRAMFGIAWDNWVETGGVHGMWRAIRVPPEQIAAADEKMNARLRETLGADRYLDYQMATSETGQQMRNLAARYDLPRETLAQAFQLQTEADQLNKTIARSQPSGNPADPSQLVSRLTELQQQTEQILGPAIWQAWTDGRTQRVKLEP